MNPIKIILEVLEFSVEHHNTLGIKIIFQKHKLDYTEQTDIEILSLMNMNLSKEDRAKMIMMYLSLKVGAGKKFDADLEKDFIKKYLYKKRDDEQ